MRLHVVILPPLSSCTAVMLITPEDSWAPQREHAVSTSFCAKQTMSVYCSSGTTHNTNQNMPKVYNGIDKRALGNKVSKCESYFVFTSPHIAHSIHSVYGNVYSTCSHTNNEVIVSPQLWFKVNFDK